jgi:hypothetical protein
MYQLFQSISHASRVLEGGASQKNSNVSKFVVEYKIYPVK